VSTLKYISTEGKIVWVIQRKREIVTEERDKDCTVRDE
jgi:hypothetical protein